MSFGFPDQAILLLSNKMTLLAKLLIDNEFIGVVFEDNEDGDTCFQFNMTILSEDLED